MLGTIRSGYLYMSKNCSDLLKIAIIKFMRIIFMHFQHESTVTENASSGEVNLNRHQSDLQKDLHHLMELYQLG